MKIYFAGVPGGGAKEEKKLIYSTVLLSYFYQSKEIETMNESENIKGKIDLFLDSGAFSAKTQGAKIDIYEYINFIKKNKKIINVYANLDVIGDPEKTAINQRIMEKEGLKPLPVFHFGEDEEKYLKPMIKKYDYIALGGLVKAGNLTAYLDRLHNNYICDDKGMPKVKVHGFGLTSTQHIVRYPWYSVDSTSWGFISRYGGIYMPKYKNGKWLYNENAITLSVSSKCNDKKFAGRHFLTLTPKSQEVVLKYLALKGYEMGRSSFKEVPCNYELKENEKFDGKKSKEKNQNRMVEVIEEIGIATHYQLRDEINIQYFLDLGQSVPKWPWAFSKKSITGFGL